jgi:transcriptional regulator with GAF, ATPase, and Fis domain
MRRIFAVLERVAPTESTLLIEGETGTGKELVARGIHEASQRSGGPFVVFDCSAVAPTLAESALFGHIKGAFTGATADHPGVFEQADGGTLFLDELGELPSELQPKLLRAIENREVLPLGATRSRRGNVRIVAATNRSLAREVDRGLFREDLYYRIAVITIRLPPLRERLEDVPLLVRHFAAELRSRSHPSVCRRPCCRTSSCAPSGPSPGRGTFGSCATPWTASCRSGTPSLERPHRLRCLRSSSGSRWTSRS